MNIREDIEDILLDLKDEEIEYKVDIFNDIRRGWCGWITQRINVSFGTDSKEYPPIIGINTIDHLTNYVKDIGYSVELDTDYSGRRIIKYSRNIKDKRK